MASFRKSSWSEDLNFVSCIAGRLLLWATREAWAAYVWACVSVTRLCPTLCGPKDYSSPGSSLHRILQTRMLEWVAIPFSRASSWPRLQTRVSHIAGRFITIWAIREAQDGWNYPYLRDNKHRFQILMASVDSLGFEHKPPDAISAIQYLDHRKDSIHVLNELHNESMGNLEIHQEVNVCDSFSPFGVGQHQQAWRRVTSSNFPGQD